MQNRQITDQFSPVGTSQGLLVQSPAQSKADSDSSSVAHGLVLLNKKYLETWGLHHNF